METIRKSRGVPAKRGMRVFYGHKGRHGTIKSARGGYLKIQLDGDKSAGVYHPTWELDYLDDDGKVIHSTRKKGGA